MMKKYSFLLLCLLVSACSTTSNTPPVVDSTTSTSDSDVTTVQTGNSAPQLTFTAVPKSLACDVDEMKAIVACTHAVPIPNGATFGTMVDALLTDRKTIEGCRTQLDKLRESVEDCNERTELYNAQVEQINKRNLHQLEVAANALKSRQTPASTPTSESTTPPAAENKPAWWMFWRKQ